MTDTDTKEALKEALKEWLDAKYLEVGKWTVRTIATATFGALMYLFLTINGWHK